MGDEGHHGFGIKPTKDQDGFYDLFFYTDNDDGCGKDKVCIYSCGEEGEIKTFLDSMKEGINEIQDQFKITCPYCHKEAKIVDSKVIYGKSYGKIYLCVNYPRCDSYVGCHKGTDRPLGTLANSELRSLRKLAHHEFDSLWKHHAPHLKRKYNIPQQKVRSDYYESLAGYMGITLKECHIGMFNIPDCKSVIEFTKIVYLKGR